MKPYIKLFVLLLAAFFLIQAPPALAARCGKDSYNTEELSLEEIMQSFIDEHGLDKSNFAVGYYDTATSEQYFFNEAAHFKAGSTYKLALNMYYTELVNDGQMSWDDEINGHTLRYIQEQSLQFSDNDLSMDMVHAIMNGKPFSYYRTVVAEYSGMDDLEYIYYVDNYVCAEYLLKTVKYLYEHADEFPTVIGYLKQAQQDQYFAGYIDDYEVAHKYGMFEGALNDVGIIYTPTPFLLAVLTYNLDGADTLLCEIAAILAEYTVNAHSVTPQESTQAPETSPQTSSALEHTPPAQSAEATQEPAQTHSPGDGTEQPESTSEAQQPGPGEQKEERSGLIWFIAAAGGAIAVAALFVVLSVNRKHGAREKTRSSRRR